MRKDYTLLHTCFQKWQNEQTETYSKELINTWFIVNSDYQKICDLYNKLQNKYESEIIISTVNNIIQNNSQINVFCTKYYNSLQQQMNKKQNSINDNTQ